MAKAFTYSRLPEHQVAVYFDEHDKKGKRVLEMRAPSKQLYRTNRSKKSKKALKFKRLVIKLKIFLILAYFNISCFSLDGPSGWNIAESLISFFTSLLLLVTFPASVFFCVKVSSQIRRGQT